MINAPALVSKRLREVRFVVNANLLWTGSTLMRSQQLGEALASELGDDFAFSIVKMPTGKWHKAAWVVSQPKDCLLIFTKQSLGSLSQRMLDLLRKRNVRTCLDYVDRDLNIALKFRPDVHIASSLAAQAMLEKLIGPTKESHQKIKLLHHGADPRLAEIEFGPFTNASAVYLGLRSNGYITPAIEDYVDVLAAGSTSEMESSLASLHKYNLHYCVRSPEADTERTIVRPFTKGFTAAMCGAPVIVNREELDAVALLGEDYPYFVTSRDEASVTACIEDAMADFGGSNWVDARDRVANLSSVFSPPALARQFVDIMNAID